MLVPAPEYVHKFAFWRQIVFHFLLDSHATTCLHENIKTIYVAEQHILRSFYSKPLLHFPSIQIYYAAYCIAENGYRTHYMRCSCNCHSKPEKLYDIYLVSFWLHPSSAVAMLASNCVREYKSSASKWRTVAVRVHEICLSEQILIEREIKCEIISLQIADKETAFHAI